MAEILLSLTIIGVVAAITLPSLTGNINERTWNTQRKALYARFSQALALMPNLNSFGSYKTEQTDADGNVTQSAVDTAAETFLTEGLSKVLKINNICDSEHLADCGIPTSYTNLMGSVKSMPTKLSELNSLFRSIDTKAAAFETQNGESIVLFYNPSCVGNLNETVSHSALPKMCANFIYDLNGAKGPNTFGKDIGFVSALYSTDPVVVAPIPLTKYAGHVAQTAAGSSCTKQNSESRLPSLDELSSMFYNKELLGIVVNDLWSGTVMSSTTAWRMHFGDGNRLPFRSSDVGNVLCIKR